jgi:hypothetical protein
MPINFPNSPSPNQQYTYDNKTWEWNGTYWEVYSALTGYITSAYTVGNGVSDISGVTNGNIVLKSFSGINLTILDNNDKLTFSASPYFDTTITGATYSNNTFTYTNNTGGSFNVLFDTVTGLTSTGTISSNIISATTYQNLPSFNSVRINNTTQFSGVNNNFINFSGINLTITSAATNTLVLSAGTGGETVTSVQAIAPITSSSGATPTISTSMNTNRIIGRTTTGTGVMEEIQIGNFLSLSGGVLSGVPPVETGQLYTNGWNIAPTIIGNTTGGGSTGSANSWALVARYFAPNRTISQIGLRVDAFTTNVTLRLAIYDSTYDSTNCRFIPNNRIGNSGAISVTGLGFYSFTFPSILTVSGWVFFCMGFTGTGCSYRNVATASIIGLPAQLTTGTPQGTSSSGKNGKYDNTTNSTSSDPPNPWTGTLTQNNSNIPAIYFFVP